MSSNLLHLNAIFALEIMPRYGENIDDILTFMVRCRSRPLREWVGRKAEQANIRRSLASFATTMLVASGLALGISIGSGQVSAALAFYIILPVIDAGGANDVSGQGDLTQFMFGDGTVGRQLDDTARSGKQLQ